MKKILYIVDVQYDFMEGGVLAVPKANEIIPFINKLIRIGGYDTIFLTKDLHPLNHKSFAINCNVEPYTVVNNEMKWPVHCIAGTKGAQIHEDLTFPAEMSERVNILNKGTNPQLEEYSGYSLKIQSDPQIGAFVQQWVKGSVVDVVGLATDFCVRATALDLFKHAKVNVIMEGCRGVNSETTKMAIGELKKIGVNVLE